MHQYLRSIGFSQYKKEQDIDDLLTGLEQQYYDCARRYADENDEMHIEIRANVAGAMGLCITGIIDRDGNFKRQDYYPYLISKDISTTASAQAFRRIDGRQYSALLEDPRVGVTLIFLLDNSIDYLQRIGLNNTPKTSQTALTAFSTNGRVILPATLRSSEKRNAEENDTESQDPKKPENSSPIANNIPSALDVFEAARAGNTAAIEQVAFEEMSAIAKVSRRLQSEDIYSIVESVFMPQGVECDLYQIVGEIIDVAHTANLYTGEGIYDLTINVNDMIMHVATNEADLEGEPLPGRRFKGRIWLLGRMEF